MAKRKRHKKKQYNHKNSVDKSTTSTVKLPNKKTANRGAIASSSSDAGSLSAIQAEGAIIMSDVRYGLAVVAVITLIFVGIYVALQNPSIADSVYGVIKLNNINF